jgi:GNAT superfamily N-acetyltransferase
MTPAQYEAYWPIAQRDYAATIAESGSMPEPEAREKAAADFAELLPEGLDTPDHLFWVAYDGDEEVGMLWLNVRERSDGRHAFGYDFSVREDRRRRGYGRAIMLAAELKCRELGVVSVGLNVFGHNLAARDLYEKMGFEPTSIQMRKLL